MKQADLGLNLSTKRTRKREFLDEMNRVVPWAALVELIGPHYPKGKTGRPPMGIETMLRIHFLQQWFGLSDPAMEEALHDVPLYREFADLEGPMRRLPDESTILRFRHLLEEHGLAAPMFATVNNYYFGMKAHIGADADSGLVHTVICTPANTSDVTQAEALLHGEEEIAFGDAGYQGAHKRPEATMKNWLVAMRPGKRRKLDPSNPRDAIVNEIERLKASVRAKVEHPFRVIKRQFGFTKVRYRGLAKNTAQLTTLFALSNLWMARRKLMAMTP